MKSQVKRGIWAVLLAGSALCLAAPSFAQDGHSSFHAHAAPHGAPPSGSAPHWSGYHGPHVTFTAHASFSHFTPAQHAAWVGGHWNHSWHNGHFGWLWFAGGLWYFYDAPIYPYPLYVSDEYIDDYSGDNGGGQYWYYCQNPAGYYPYVQQCSMPWQPVPATPPPPPPPSGGGYGPPPGYDQGPGPGGYQGPPSGDDQGPPPGYQDQGPPPGPGDQGPPPGPGDQGPPPGPGHGSNN